MNERKLYLYSTFDQQVCSIGRTGSVVCKVFGISTHSFVKFTKYFFRWVSAINNVSAIGTERLNIFFFWDLMQNHIEKAYCAWSKCDSSTMECWRWLSVDGKPNWILSIPFISIKPKTIKTSNTLHGDAPHVRSCYFKYEHQLHFLSRKAKRNVNQSAVRWFIGLQCNWIWYRNVSNAN